MKRRIGLVVVILLVVAAVLAWRTYFQKKGDGDVLLLSGNMEVTETNVGFKLAGRVIELAVDEGQQVQKDQLLARLDNAELAAVVTQNRAALQEAISHLAELKTGSRPQEIEEATENLRFQQAELARLKQDFDRADRLYKQEAIPTSQYDAAKAAYETRVALEKSAAQSLSLVKEGPKKETISAAEHRVEQAEAAVQASEERLKDTTIYAPGSGVILRKNVELGETVATGTPVYTIGDLSSPWIKVYVPEAKLGLIRLGQKALVSADTYPGKTYDGWVSYISSEAEFTPKNVQTQEERVKLVYAVKVRVNNPDQELKPGMPADVRIELREPPSPPARIAGALPAKPAEEPPPPVSPLPAASSPETSNQRSLHPRGSIDRLTR